MLKKHLICLRIASLNQNCEIKSTIIFSFFLVVKNKLPFIRDFFQKCYKKLKIFEWQSKNHPNHIPIFQISGNAFLHFATLKLDFNYLKMKTNIL